MRLTHGLPPPTQTINLSLMYLCHPTLALAYCRRILSICSCIRSVPSFRNPPCSIIPVCLANRLGARKRAKGQMLHQMLPCTSRWTRKSSLDLVFLFTKFRCCHIHITMFFLPTNLQPHRHSTCLVKEDMTMQHPNPRIVRPKSYNHIPSPRHTNCILSHWVLQIQHGFQR